MRNICSAPTHTRTLRILTWARARYLSLARPLTFSIPFIRFLPLRVVDIPFYGFFMCARIMSSLTLYVHELYLATSFHIQIPYGECFLFMGEWNIFFLLIHVQKKKTSGNSQSNRLWSVYNNSNHHPPTHWSSAANKGARLEIKIESQEEKQSEYDRMNMKIKRTNNNNNAKKNTQHEEHEPGKNVQPVVVKHHTH